MKSETIIALSSGSLPAGVAVVRSSGAEVPALAVQLLGFLPEPRRAAYARIRRSGEAEIDRGIALFFPRPSSFTGEDVLELHVHGGRAVVDAILRAACEFEGVRLAEAGEFTRRAFVNGKLGLLDAEATANLINAETEAQAAFAATLRSGEHHALYHSWRHRLIQARALLEAEVDFVDEGDVTKNMSAHVRPDIATLSAEMKSHASGFAKAEILRDGRDVVLLGPPNSGKSTLLNALIDREAALVSDIPGTTRDLIEVALDIGGYKIRLTDTAGIRDSSDKIEEMGIERALTRASDADVVLQLTNLTDPLQPRLSFHHSQVLTIGTKLDIAAATHSSGRFDFEVSALTGAGLQDLTAYLSKVAAKASPKVGEIIPWRRRHLDLIESAVWSLDAASRNENDPIEIRIEHLRAASDSIGRISGEVGVEDLLDVIFSQFCIGK